VEDPLKVSEKIKWNVEAIATALVDDMKQGIRDGVANDPRWIQKQCIKPRRKLEKEIICQYQREMSERHKEKLVVYNFVTTTAISGLLRTQRSVQHCRKWAGGAAYGDGSATGQEGARRDADGPDGRL
jgi:hypothetical protein